MQDRKGFFSQKTTGNGFPRRILSFLMGAAKERYDFIQRGFKPCKIVVASDGEMWYNMEKFPPKERMTQEWKNRRKREPDPSCMAERNM